MNAGALNGKPSMYVKRTTEEKRRKAIEQFLSRMKESESGCWLWENSLDSGGYGRFHMFGKQVGAHRASYILFKGDPGDLLVLHNCNVFRCVNPDHLFLGTTKEKKPGGRPRLPLGTPCINGHVAPRNKHGKCIQCVAKGRRRLQKLGPKWLRGTGAEWIKSSGLRIRSKKGEQIANRRDLFSLWVKQKGRCALTGLPIVGRAELDHKTPVSKGGSHTIDNLQWTDRKANGAKRDGSDSEFQEWVLAAAKSIARVRRLEKATRRACQKGLFP